MNKIFSFFKRHPKARFINDLVLELSNKLQIISWMIIAIFITAFIILLYIRLPEELKKPVTIIVGTVFTTFAIPLLIERIKYKREIKKANYEKCSSYYNELIKLIVDVLQHNEVNERKSRLTTLCKYLNDNYYNFCLYFDSNILMSVKDIKKECDYYKDNEAKFSLKTFMRYSEKCLNYIRKQGNIKGERVYFNLAFIKID